MGENAKARLSADDIFAEFARERDTVEVAPGKFVDVLAIGLGARVAISELKALDVDGQLAWLVSKGCPAFAGISPDEIESRLDPAVLSKIASRIMELSGLGADAEAQAEKNSESDPS
jgi:hypothetical protein